jgi:Asp-tRNA(Asn)/Glu-tRNA(Gln) amidotransferase A subunit family amidase
MRAVDLAAAYAGGETSPEQVITELTDRIDRLNPQINAYVALADDLQAQASESRRRLENGTARSGLEGIPVALKDNLSMAGLPASWGGAVFCETREQDELPVQRLRAAGAILVGKTNTPEFAVEGYTANATFGVTRNPWDLGLTPGGSSGGSVAAVASGLASVALGTDGGGSIRRPCGHTGLYGLKPTSGAVSRHGGLPQILMDFEVVGPIARNVADLRLVYSAICGPDRLDPSSRIGSLPDPKKFCLKILYVERFDGNPLDPQIRAAARGVATELEKLGHQVTRAPLPFDLTALDAFWGKFAQIGLSHMVASLPAMAQNASQMYLDMARQGDEIPARDLFGALAAVQRLRSDVSASFENWDVIMTPSAAAQPWAAETGFPDIIDGQKVGPRGHAIYTGWVNASGHPGITIPAGPDAAGLPIGVQLIGDRFSETMLLDLAAAHEAAGPGWHFPAFASN